MTAVAGLPHGLLDPPYATAQKPYGHALLALATERPEVVVLSADLTRQTETDLVRDALPAQFVNVGMAEQNLMGIASGLARSGRTVFVHTFGVFATRRPYEQVAMQIAYPRAEVKIVGFMPGLSSPGGPSHQAVDDVALMRALPNMTVIDVADATEARQVVRLVADLEGPCYVRLKRGELPVLFDDTHVLDARAAQSLARGVDVVVVACGMLLPTAIRARKVLAAAGVDAGVLHVPVLKPIDGRAVLDAARAARAVVTAENHGIVGGLGSAVAEVLAEAGIARPLRRVGVRDTFAQASSTAYLFRAYGLDVASVLAAAWDALGREGLPPTVDDVQAPPGSYAPV